MATTIKLKNSVVSGKTPTASDLVIGELALNANTATPALYFKDSADNIIALEPGIESPVTSVNTKIGDVVLNAADVGAATTAQGLLADTALQPADIPSLDFIPVGSWSALPVLP